MARTKKNSKVMDESHSLQNALEAIDSKLDLGNSLTLDVFGKSSKLVDDKLAAYNASLSVADIKRQEYRDAEKEHKLLMLRYKNGVKSKYGLESDEYATIGGIRPSERKSNKRKKPDAK